MEFSKVIKIQMRNQNIHRRCSTGSGQVEKGNYVYFKTYLPKLSGFTPTLQPWGLVNHKRFTDMLRYLANSFNSTVIELCRILF